MSRKGIVRETGSSCSAAPGPKGLGARRRCAGAISHCAAAQPAWPRSAAEGGRRRPHSRRAGAPSRAAQVGNLIGAHWRICDRARVRSTPIQASLLQSDMRVYAALAASEPVQPSPRAMAKALKTIKESSPEYYKFLMLRPGRCNAKRFMVSQMMPGGHRTKKMETSQ